MNPGRHMTFLGLLALAYYAVLLASGAVSTDVMPQFVVSAILFLSSGRLLRKTSAIRVKDKKKVELDKPRKEPDWALRTQVLNWVMTILVLLVLGLWVMKPVGVSFLEMLDFG